MSAVRIVVVLFGGLFLVLGPLRRPGDGDLWWQRWLGELILRDHVIPSRLGLETFGAPGAPWVPQEWVFSVLVAWTTQHGMFVVFAIIISLIPTAIMLSIVARSRPTATYSAIAVALLFTALALAASFGVRAQVLGWGCFAAFLLALNRRDSWFYLAVPVAILWANLHASALLAPVYLALFVIGQILDGGLRVLRTSRELRVLPLITMAMICTPFGWHLPAYAVALSVSPIRHYINEWQPVSFNDVDFFIGALPIALILAAGIKITLGQKSEALPVVVLFLAAVLAKRDAPLFAIAAAPLAAHVLDGRFPSVRSVEKRTREMERFAIVAIAIALIVNALALVAVQRVEPPVLPVAAIARAATGGRKVKLFCQDFSHCSLALQYPNVRVFMDGRCDPYPIRVWREYLSIVRAQEGWQGDLERLGVSFVVTRRDGRLNGALAASPAWRNVFQDPTFVLYART